MHKTCLEVHFCTRVQFVEPNDLPRKLHQNFMKVDTIRKCTTLSTLKTYCADVINSRSFTEAKKYMTTWFRSALRSRCCTRRSCPGKRAKNDTKWVPVQACQIDMNKKDPSQDPKEHWGREFLSQGNKLPLSCGASLFSNWWCARMIGLPVSLWNGSMWVIFTWRDVVDFLWASGIVVGESKVPISSFCSYHWSVASWSCLNRVHMVTLSAVTCTLQCMYAVRVSFMQKRKNPSLSFPQICHQVVIFSIQ